MSLLGEVTGYNLIATLNMSGIDHEKIEVKKNILHFISNFYRYHWLKMQSMWNFKSFLFIFYFNSILNLRRSNCRTAEIIGVSPLINSYIK
jgi:hypothetical protein